jgi:single-strand DNA-binding protein
LNKAMIIGRLGRDPELRFTQSNTAVCTFSVATDERWTDKASGEKKEETEWHKIVVWGRQGENCNEYLSKGRLVFIEGRIKTREWEDKKGERRWTTEIVAQRVQFLGGRDDAGSKRPSGGPPPHADSDSKNDSGFDPGFSDDQIPF